MLTHMAGHKHHSCQSSYGSGVEIRGGRGGGAVSRKPNSLSAVEWLEVTSRLPWALVFP